MRGFVRLDMTATAKAGGVRVRTTDCGAVMASRQASILGIATPLLDRIGALRSAHPPGGPSLSVEAGCDPAGECAHDHGGVLSAPQTR